MLGGQPPFTGPTVESVVRQPLTVEPRPVSQLRPAVPSEIAALLARALAKNPADRFNPESASTNWAAGLNRSAGARVGKESSRPVQSCGPVRRGALSAGTGVAGGGPIAAVHRGAPVRQYERR